MFEMSGRGKAKTRGVTRRGKGKGKVGVKAANGAVAVNNDEVPELDDGPILSSIVTPVRSSMRLNSLQPSHEEVDEIFLENDTTNDEDVLETVPDVGTPEKVNDLNQSREKSESSDDSPIDKGSSNDILEAMAIDSPSPEKSNTGAADDMLPDESENDDDKNENDDDKNEVTAEDTEMVSEDEYFVDNKEPLNTEAVSDEELQGSQSSELPETEAVSDEELPEDKRKKAKVEEAEAVSEDDLPDEAEKKQVEVIESEMDEINETDEIKVKEGKRKLPEVDYDPSSPTSEESQDETPAAKKIALADGKDAAKPTAKKSLPELEKYWKAVNDDSSDFTGWTYLLQYVDQENDIDVAREAYNAFLSHYPYCYGYWRKFADLEKRKGNINECEKVFERGLKAIPLSVDLWLHYLNYVRAAQPDNNDYIREQYERALKSCGIEFRSDRLWDHYLKWEKEKKNLINITALYDRLLAIPTQTYTTHFDNFQDHVNGNSPQTILPVDDFLELRREVVSTMKHAKPSAPAVGEDAPPGEDIEDSSAATTARMEEETSALREKILSLRRKIHKSTVSAVASRWNYEEGIKRPYFHVKPLERCQLKNWKEYLDFEIEQGDEARVITLFERCLIACALYEEFWVRFIRYLEGQPGDQFEKMRDVYERACLIHHKKKPNLHLQWAVFEESRGDYEKAASILESLEKSTPNMLQVAYRRINLERRRGNYERASELYEDYLAANKNKATLTNMTVKYARFTWKMLNDIDKAIAILERALEKDKENTRLYLQLIDMGLQKNPVDEDKIVGILDQFLEKEGDPEQKLMFAQRKIEFLEDFGSNIEKVQKAQDEFQKYVKLVKDKKKKTEQTEQPPTPQAAAAAATASSTPTPQPAKKKPDATPAVTSVPPPAVPPANQNVAQGYPQGYPPNYYGQYPPQTGDQTGSYPNNYPSGYNNYSNWNNYPQGNYPNYGQQNWPGYYPNYQ